MANEICEPSVFTRGFCDECEIRSIDEQNRTAEFVAATERGVDTWGGKEYLRMSGIRLQRFRKNPIILDAHDNGSTRNVIGNADVKVEGKALVARIKFATTALAEDVWNLVKNKFVRALSVGFMPVASSIKRLSDGEIEGEGEDAITGPARIIKQWELYEISVVPVPADPDSLARKAGDRELSPFVVESLTHILQRLNPDGAERGQEMAEDTVKQPDPAPQGDKANGNEERAVENAEVQRAAAIRAIAPDGMKDLANQCVLEGLTVEDARKRMLDELKEKTKPVGTPEPEQPKTEQKRELKDMSVDEFARELIG